MPIVISNNGKQYEPAVYDEQGGIIKEEVQADPDIVVTKGDGTTVTISPGVCMGFETTNIRFE